MPQKKLDKQLLLITLYFIERLDGVLGKTHLQKLLFLTDLIAAKRIKQRITTIEYKKYRYGPFSPELEKYTDTLIRKKLIEEREFPFVSNSHKKYTRYYIKKGISAKPSLVKEIGNEKVMLIDEIISSYGNMSLQEVVDVVYKLQIVKESEMNKPLDMAKEMKKEETNLEEDIF